MRNEQILIKNSEPKFRKLLEDFARDNGAFLQE